MTAELLKRSKKNKFAGLSSGLFKASAGGCGFDLSIAAVHMYRVSPSCSLAFEHVILLLSKRLRLLFR